MQAEEEIIESSETSAAKEAVVKTNDEIYERKDL